MYKPILVAAPSEAPITLAEAKDSLRVDTDNTDEDAFIGVLIAAAVSVLDGWSGILGRCLVTQTWRQSADSFSSCMRLPLPAASIVSVKSRSAAGVQSTVATSSYQLLTDALGSYIRFGDSYIAPADLAEAAGVDVDFLAGYGAATLVPTAIKQAMLLLIGHWYANRETVSVGNMMSELPFATRALLAPFALKSI